MNRMTDLDLAYTPATTLVRMVNEKQISPVEVINNCLERIEEVNSKLNCFCFTYPEEALEKARQAEQAVEYKQLEIARTETWRKLAAILSNFDGLLCPVMTMAAPEIGASYLDFYKIDDDGTYHGMDLTAVFNLFG